MNRVALALVLLAGCPGPESEPVKPVKPVQPEKPPEVAVKTPVVVRQVAVQFVKDQGANNVRLLLQFEEGAEPGPAALDKDRNFVTEDDGPVPAKVNDAGRDGDLVAGDHIWGGYARFDHRGHADRMAAWQQRYEATSPRPPFILTDYREVIAHLEADISLVDPRSVAIGKGTEALRALATRVQTLPLERAVGAKLDVKFADFRAVPEEELDGLMVALWPPDGMSAIANFLDQRILALIVNGTAPVSDPMKTEMVVNRAILEDPSRSYFRCTNTTTPTVVGTSPDNVWSFKHAMEGIAGGADAATRQTNAQLLVTDWMTEWATTDTVNSQPVPAANSAAQVAVLDKWRADSAALHTSDPDPWPAGRLDLTVAPYKLVAIVNRLDLAGNSAYGGDAGEGRLLFALTNNNAAGCPTSFAGVPPDVLPAPQVPVPQAQVVILEYGLPFSSCSANRDWAQDWIDLNAFDTTTAAGQASYGAALALLTEQFVGVGASGARPNGSAINQVRTNDFVFNVDAAAPAGTKADWELREFRLGAGTSGVLLDQVTIKQTPGETVSAANVDDFISDNAAAILTETHEVTDTHNGSPFMGSYAAYDGLTVWGDDTPTTGTTYSLDVRHKFGINTCDGCHRAETSGFFPAGSPAAGEIANFNTTFLHVDPRTPPAGASAALSSFLTTTQAVDLPFGCAAYPPGTAIGTCVTSSFPGTVLTFSGGMLAARVSDLEFRAGQSCLVTKAPFLNNIQKFMLAD